MSSGPFLYDEDPEPLHTGTARTRNGLLVAILLGTVLVAVGFAVALPLVRGSAGEQASEVAGVFVAALQQDDTGTAYDLLCADERGRLRPEDVAAEYLRPGRADIGGTTDADSGSVLVDVRWTDGSAVTDTTLTVVSEAGARICGTTPGG